MTWAPSVNGPLASRRIAASGRPGASAELWSRWESWSDDPPGAARRCGFGSRLSRLVRATQNRPFAPDQAVAVAVAVGVGVGVVAAVVVGVVVAVVVGVAVGVTGGCDDERREGGSVDGALVLGAK